MALYHEDFVNIELTSGSVHRSFLNRTIGEGDALANRFGICAFRNGEAETLGGTCTGYFIKSDGGTVVIQGTVSGNTAYVDLPQACYADEGQFALAIKVSSGSVTGTMRIVDGVVANTTTDTLIDPGTILPAIETLLEEIEAAVASIPSGYEDMWTTFAPAFDTDETYDPGRFVTDDGKFYRIVRPHTGSWSEDDATETDVGAELTELRNQTRGYNAFNILEHCNKNNTTSNHVTFTFSGNTVNANGETQSDSGYVQIFNTAQSLEFLEAGKSYYVVYSSEKINLSIYYRLSGGETTKLADIKKDRKITIPSGTITTLYFRLRVDPNTAVNETVELPIMFDDNVMTALLYNTSAKKGSLPSLTDLDTVVEPGNYFCSSKTASTAYVHYPFEASSAAGLEVVEFSSNYLMQRLTKYSDATIMIRFSTTGHNLVGRGWIEISGSGGGNTYVTQYYDNTYNITTNPTITTDTNNYLAAPGDDRDMTGAIQTLLTNTGVCHLGPGDFYVTGVEVPNGGLLIGSGNVTRLILASSVAQGCAVNMKDNCSVQNLEILGQTGTYTISSTVGSRHGILYEGTATSSESPSTSRRFRGTIDNVFIARFNGGGITCNATGGQINSNLLVTNCHIYQCDAGINVAFYSEFHRFTNVSATHCYYGCICNGGNVNFVNCSFSYDRIGILLDNSSSQSPNNSHGTFDACTICHSGANNDGVAIKLLNVHAGEIFSGLQVFYGSIYVDSSSYIRFIGMNMGSATPITVTNSSLVVFSDCTMHSSSELTQSNNTTLKFHDCYYRSGTPYDPMA